MRIELRQLPGAFAEVAAAIGTQGAILGAIDLVRVDRGGVVRDVTVACIDAAHAQRVVNAVRALEGVKVASVSDRTFLLHKGGKIEITPKVAIKTRDDLSMAYTPGVARVSAAIHDDPDSAWTLTIKGNTVAVVTDGSAVLGLGDIGPGAAMPVMEGKAMLFKEFAGVDAAGPMSPRPSTAVPSETTAIVLPLIVSVQADSGSSWIALETRPTPGV